MSKLSLTSDEREQLGVMLETAPKGMQKRIKLLTLYDQGLATLKASRQAGYSPSRARYWKRQFLLRGMDIFKTRNPRQPALAVRLNDDDFIVHPSLSKPGILPDDAMSEAGRKIIHFHFLEMVKHEAGTLLGEEIEELHDMRVATRRMRAAFDIFGTYFDFKTIHPILQGLKATGRILGEVRDLDVFLEKANTFLERLPIEQRSGLNPLLDHLRARLDRARQGLVNHLNSQVYLDFKTIFTLFLETPGMGVIRLRKGAPVQTTVRFLAPPLIYSRLASVMAFDSILNTASYAQLHALRIEFKKFRYTLEFFKEVLGEESLPIIDEIKKLQDHLGELNDANVACQTITRLLKKWDIDESSSPLLNRLNPEPVVNYLAYHYAERHRLMVAFPEIWQQFSRPELRQNLAKAVSSL